MQTAFEKLLAFWILFSCRKSVFCLLEVVLSISEGVSVPVKVLYWNEIFKMFIPRICWLYGSIKLFGYNSRNMLTLPINAYKRKSLDFSHYVTRLLSSQDHHRSSRVYFHYTHTRHSMWKVMSQSAMSRAIQCILISVNYSHVYLTKLTKDSKNSETVLHQIRKTTKKPPFRCGQEMCGNVFLI